MLKQMILRCICGGFVVGHISKFTYLVYCMDKKDRSNRIEWLINVVYSFFCAVLWLAALCAAG